MVKFEIIETLTKLNLVKALLDRKPLNITVKHGGKIIVNEVTLNSITVKNDDDAKLWLLKGCLNYSNLGFEACLQADRSWFELK